MSKDWNNILAKLDRFAGKDLTQVLKGIERDAAGVTAADCGALLDRARADRGTLRAAADLKGVAGQVNVTIHALGILLCLPHILEAGETVESVSLGAGNTGRPFDLQTNLRVAEFKFSYWRGSDAIRENATFKDFLELEAYQTSKRRHLYLLCKEDAVTFLQGNRRLENVLSGHRKVRKSFFARFGDRFQTVGEYYAAYARKVEITDVSEWVNELMPRNESRNER